MLGALAAIHSSSSRFLQNQEIKSNTLIKLILLITVTSLSTLLKAQQLLTKSQQEVQQAVVQVFEALSKRDSVSLKAHCSADISLYEYGQVWNIDTLINKAIKMNTAIDFKRSNTFDFISTETDKNTAWVTYRLSSVITKENKETVLLWLETVVLSRHNKMWKVKHLHSTLLKRS